MADERRRSQRHQTKEGALAVLSIPGQFELKLGQIADISPGGLSLIYTGSGSELLREVSAIAAELELLGHEDVHLGLKGIPCRIVYDSLLAIDPETAIETRRCGVEFIRPTNKLARLEYFIRVNEEMFSMPDLRESASSNPALHFDCLFDRIAGFFGSTGSLFLRSTLLVRSMLLSCHTWLERDFSHRGVPCYCPLSTG